MAKFKMVAPCIFGLESLVSDELKFMGAEDVTCDNGKVYFTGDEHILARANIRSRFAERILINLHTFHASTFEELFQGVKQIKWEQYIGVKDEFPVKGFTLKSQLSSVPTCQSIIKKAIVEYLKECYKVDWFDETGTLYKIRFSIVKDEVMIMLDTSGDGLHKRGYRKIANEAPLKETLAAAMCKVARVRGYSTVVDPFCGSGTILIEAAMNAMEMAPGLNRTFGCEEWGIIPQSVWEEERKLAREKIRNDIDFKAYGYDINPETIEIAKNNAKIAGVDHLIEFKVQDVKDLVLEHEKSIVITNPPYGERILDVEEAEELYRVLGKKVDSGIKATAYVISPHEEFESIFGRKADKKRKLYNGMIKCYLYTYFKYIN